MDSKLKVTQKKKRKRKRERSKARDPKTENIATNGSNATKAPDHKTSSSSKKRKRKSNPLNGLILAISTQEKNNSQESESNAGSAPTDSITYKELCSLCESLGATTTAQVHKRVFAVICNKSAVLQSTQRVRKALKKYTMILDVEWVMKCKEEGWRVDHKDFLLTDLAKEVAAKRQIVEDERARESSLGVDVQDESDEEVLKTDVGWSEPVSLDCCCVCHDDDRDDCKWCCGENMCNVNLRKLAIRNARG
jgi:hypothetical protein